MICICACCCANTNVYNRYTCTIQWAMVFPALVFVECGKVDWEVGGLRRSGAWVTQWSRFLAFWCDGSHVAFEVNLTFHGDTHIINAYINIYIYTVHVHSNF